MTALIGALAIFGAFRLVVVMWRVAPVLFRIIDVFKKHGASYSAVEVMQGEAEASMIRDLLRPSYAHDRAQLRRVLMAVLAEIDREEDGQ